jgi:integrase
MVIIDIMRRTQTNLTKTKVNGRPYYCVTWPRDGKGRNRQFFKAKPEAEAFLEIKRAEQINYGIAGMSFTELQRAEFLECSKKLEPFGATLRDATQFYLPQLQATNRSSTVKETVEEMLKVQKASCASRRHLANLRSRLGQFSSVFGKRHIAHLTVQDIDNWLLNSTNSKNGDLLSPTTRNNFRRVLVSLFNFALDRGYCINNPAKKTAKAKVIDKPPPILTVDELSRLLTQAKAEILPFLTIGAFAGLRRSEIEGLDWKWIDLDGGLIEVPAQIAKLRRRRFVQILPNLSAWLQPHVKPQGRVTPTNHWKLFKEARTAAGIAEWPDNGLRHSYASYHLAQFKSAESLALELGHTGTDILFRHYRELVKPAAAKRYWEIMPADHNAKVVKFSEAAA